MRYAFLQYLMVHLTIPADRVTAHRRSHLSLGEPSVAQSLMASQLIQHDCWLPLTTGEAHNHPNSNFNIKGMLMASSDDMETPWYAI